MSDPRYCDNPDVLMSYVYGDGDDDERRAFEAHLGSCAACAREVADLRSVRTELAAWTPPETVLDFRLVRGRPAPRRFAWLAVPALPAWAQLAAASLVVGVAVGLSGLEVRYDRQGLTMRTGWNRPAASQPVSAQPAAPAGGGEAAWRQEIAALRDEIRRGPAPTLPVSTSPGPGEVAPAASGKAMSDAEFMARVRQLVEASETRQRRELALRLTQLVRDMDTQRRADMARVADGFGVLEGRTGAAVAQQRELMNYLVRVSQKQQ